MKYIANGVELEMKVNRCVRVVRMRENESTGSIKPVHPKQIAEGKSRTENRLTIRSMIMIRNTMRKKLMA